MLGRQTFALVERSLRVDTRLKRTHFVRLAFAGLILLLLSLLRIYKKSHFIDIKKAADRFEALVWDDKDPVKKTDFNPQNITNNIFSFTINIRMN